MGKRRDAVATGPAVRKRARSGPVVLVTGFEPFGGEDVNPSWEICGQLPKRIGRARIETVRVPTRFHLAIDVAAREIARLEPAIVLCLGQAGGRAAVSVERAAINVDDARIADNAGAQPVDEPIAPAGPAAYLATVPIKAMAAAIRASGVPAEVSNTAGTFVCNHLLYGVLHFLATSGRTARAGFIHVPWLESQAVLRPGEPAMALATMVRAVEAAVAAALAHERDLKIEGGALD
jgi:pyroglutamyl-peptidase